MAPKSNQFWKLRNTDGRDKLFESPELLWTAATEYFNWCDAHPWFKVEAIKSGDRAKELVKIPTVIPYTLTGLLLYLEVNEGYWRDFKKANHEGFSSVICRVEMIIYNQKFIGAATGAFNANMISRELGQVDRLDVTSKGRALNQLPPVIIQPVQHTGYPILESEPDE